ncbi:unnamed protein product [Rotaria sp. Silwood1]|nr:unnamed protein product [Rotaria sp. Silwood1]CAF1033507.1 unnamed protein product [Rotaria sp. Silwood1]CAF3425172.1 unnamed protein product [Rotaria sp. Silwood1]CAF4684833.1 unnamed protein product [Rotaria sp. Silwood1]CAF4688238.1 unnamed protein product [Rotaria sp. Silwood1]
MFGGTSQFSFGGSTAPSNPFGATSTTTTAAPATTGFLFGSTPTPATNTAAPSLNSTFTFGTPTGTASTATPAASQPLTFGTGLQNTSTIRPFGSTTTFGTTPASTTPATGTTGFGGTSLFGTSQQAAPTTSIFGPSATTFGAAQPAPTTSIFGSTVAGTTQVGTTVKFEAVSGQDTMRTKNNTFQTINTKLQCICAMKEYTNKSLEELRMEDYQSNRKFSATPSLFGSTTFSSATPFSPAPFGASTTYSAPSTAPNIFGSTTTTTASPFAATATSAPSFTFGTSTAPTTSMFGTSAATTASPFGTATSTTPATSSLFGTAQPSTSIFGSTTTASPFGAKPATTQPTFGFGTTSSTSTPFSFGSQPTPSTSIFSHPTTSTPFGTTGPTTTTSIFGVPTSTTTANPTITNPFGTQSATTNIFGTTTSAAAPVFGATTSSPAFTGFGSSAPAATTSIFGNPATSTASTAPVFGGFSTTTAAPASAPFSFPSTGTSTAPTLFGSTAPATTTSSIFNPQPFTGFNFSQSQPTASTATPSFGFSTPFGSSSTTTTATTGFAAPTNITQIQSQQSVSLVQQRFLAASLLDPFASRGKKDFNNIDQIKPPTDLIVVSTSSTTPTTITTSTASPITLSLQSNSRKTSSARPLVDIRFKLKPVSSSSSPNIINDEIKSPNQPITPTTGQIKSPLTADFSEEEELVLIGRNKMSKLRLSNDFIDSSFQSESIRSLYPLRRLAELETLANMNNNTNILSTVHTIPSSTSSTTTIDTASAHVSSTTVNNEQTLNPTNVNRGMLPLHHSTPLIVHKQPSPPMSHPSTTLVQSPTSPPPPSTTPPPSSTSTSSIQRTKPSHDYDYTNITKSNSISNAYHLPKLTREYYYMRPSMSELKSLFDDQGQCIVKQFTVGHEKYGSVTFYGQVNVAGLDLDRIIEIDRHEVTVYPDDNNKPPVGKELNIPARITLYGVYPIDRTTRKEITEIERIRAMNYNDYLREVTKKFDGEFINYGVTDGSWTFMVKHFTRYGLDGSEDDFVVVVKQPQQQITKPIHSNFLDQTIALNDTYALSSPKSQPMDMEEKENTTSLITHPQQRQQQNVRFTNQSLIGLRPNDVEQLVQSMFCDDDDEDDFDGFQPTNDQMITSTKIITSDSRSIPIAHEPLIEKHTTVEQDKTQITFNAPLKPMRERVYSNLPKNIAKIRGKYFRTNFSHYLQYGSIDTLNETRILLQTPMNFNQQTMDELENFLEIYFSSCVQQIEGNSDVPYFQVRQDPDVVQRFIDFYTKVLDEKNMDDNNSFQSLADYSLQVFELCRLLWGPIETPTNIQIINQAYFDEQKRRHMLSNWLHQCILSQPQQQQWIMANCELLSRGLFNDCVKFARDEGDLRLAALVHAASGSNSVRDILRHCAHEDIVDVYTKDFQRTIAILSGEFIVKGHNLVDQNRTIYWQMALALHLWFANSASDSISTIVRDFETAYQDHYWLEPIAHYGNTKALDLRWKLLKLYTDDTYPIDNVFDVHSYTQNAFDYRLSWMLYITLQSLGSYPLSIENDACLHVNFARQLENLGFWQLAIFVLLHINESTNRKKMINEFLHRHVTSNIDLTQEEQTLVDKYNIPINMILSAKAQRAEYDKQWMNAVRLWIDAKQWRKAHDTYCYYVFHDTLLKGDYEFAKEVLDLLDHQRANIAHWSRRGGFARQYIELLIIFDRIRHGQTSLSNRIHTNILSQVHRLCDQLADVIADKYFKKISLIDISRRLLSILNYALICSNIPNLINDSDENFARKLNLFHQSILSSVPCSLPIDLLLEQIELKYRSHRH